MENKLRKGMTVPYGTVTQQVLELLADEPMTRGDICLALGRTRNECAAILSRLNRAWPKSPKRVYIKDWVYRDELNTKNYPRALYALGDKKDKPKPAPDHNAAVRRWRANQKNKVASVFDLGLTRVQRRAKKKEILAGATRTL